MNKIIVKSEIIAESKCLDLIVNYTQDEDGIEMLATFIEFTDGSKIDITDVLDLKQYNYVLDCLYNV